jgi:hypothetical protein
MRVPELPPGRIDSIQPKSTRDLKSGIGIGSPAPTLERPHSDPGFCSGLPISFRVVSSAADERPPLGAQVEHNDTLVLPWATAAP